jgi:hypothetical protein
MTKIVSNISMQISLLGHITTIKIDFEDIRCEGVYWAELIQGRF